MAQSPELKEATKRLYCNSCKGETNHVLRGAHARRDHENEGQNWEETNYRFWTCAGCDAGTMESSSTDDTFHDDGEQMYTYSYYPPRATNELPRSRPEGAQHGPRCRSTGRRPGR